jgi:hypothetical protein
MRVALRAKQNASGALIVNVFHLEVDTLTDPPNYTNVATDINAWIGTEWNAILTTAQTFIDVTVTEETYPASVPGQGIVTRNTIGARAQADDDLSPALCALAQLRTATPKKYARGHLFLPPAMNQGASAPAGTFNVSGPYITAAVAFGLKLQNGTTVGSTSYKTIVFSKTRVARGQSPFTFPVTTVGIDVKQHFLRSRLTSP